MAKLGLVLGGGGSKGAYEMGVWKALEELDIHADIVTGTSIGAMMGAFYTQQTYEEAEHLWDSLANEKVMSLQDVDTVDFEAMIANPWEHKSDFYSYVKQKGIDIHPLENIVNEVFDADKFFSSPIEFGLMTTKLSLSTKFIEGVTKTKEELTKDNAKDYILASASAFPIFPIREVEGSSYIDGGYIDNIPIKLAKQMGATSIIAVNLNGEEHPPIQKEFETMIWPQQELGPFLAFDQEKIQRNKMWGYYDTLKAFHKKLGYTYTYELSDLDNLQAFDDFVRVDASDAMLKRYDGFRFPIVQVLENLAYVSGVPHVMVYDFHDFLKLAKDTIHEKYQDITEHFEQVEIKEALTKSKDVSTQIMLAYWYSQADANQRKKVDGMIGKLAPDTFLMSLVLQKLEDYLQTLS